VKERKKEKGFNGQNGTDEPTIVRPTPDGLAIHLGLGLGAWWKMGSRMMGRESGLWRMINLDGYPFITSLLPGGLVLVLELGQ
jgi:hypothetical protein